MVPIIMSGWIMLGLLLMRAVSPEILAETGEHLARTRADCLAVKYRGSFLVSLVSR